MHLTAADYGTNFHYSTCFQRFQFGGFLRNMMATHDGIGYNAAATLSLVHGYSQHYAGT